MAEIPSWHITGDWFDNCSCAVACPCTFAQAPDNGFCESVLFWHIRQGHYGDINLDGLSFLRVGRWEGDLWAGKAKGAAGLFIDERADERQAEVLPRIIGGQVGGFPAKWGSFFPEGRQLLGVERARITFEIAPDYGRTSIAERPFVGCERRGNESRPIWARTTSRFRSGSRRPRGTPRRARRAYLGCPEPLARSSALSARCS
jgi:hypothetical protein